VYESWYKQWERGKHSPHSNGYDCSFQAGASFCFPCPFGFCLLTNERFPLCPKQITELEFLILSVPSDFDSNPKPDFDDTTGCGGLSFRTGSSQNVPIKQNLSFAVVAISNPDCSDRVAPCAAT
jgi:hypothetical protein